jgi:hypothetical protein
MWKIVIEERQSEDQPFLTAIIQCLGSEKLAAAMKEAKGDLKLLRQRGMVECKDEHIGHWQERMISLRENPDRLLRVRRMFSDFQLPYTREDVDQVQDVFETLLESVRFAKRKNVAMRHFISAVDEHSLDPLHLDEGEATELRQLFKTKRAGQAAR